MIINSFPLGEVSFSKSDFLHFVFDCTDLVKEDEHISFIVSELENTLSFEQNEILENLLSEYFDSIINQIAALPFVKIEINL